MTDLHQQTDGKLTKCVISLLLVLSSYAHSSYAQGEVARSEKIQPLKAIQSAATNFVKNEARARGMNISDIESGRLDPRLRLAACDQALSTFSPYNVPFSHRTTVGVRCEGSIPWTVYVPVSIVTKVTVLSLLNPKTRGAVITADDLMTAQQTDLRGDVPYLVNPRDAIGKQTTRPLARGTVLQASMLQQRRVIKKGDNASMVVRAGNLKVRTTGEALQDGAAGDWIALSNVRSGQRVEGKVQSDGSVVIGH